MPVIKSAAKKLRKDKKREKANTAFSNVFSKLAKNLRKKASQKNIIEIIRVTDKLVKKNIFHKNKAARIKSRYSKILASLAKK